jgi:hypothetical protein
MKTFTKNLSLLCLITLIASGWAKGNNIPASESFRTNLYVINSDNSLALADGTLAQYNNIYSAAVDFNDVIKLGNINETLSLLRDSVMLAIERRPIIGVTDTLFFNLRKTTQRAYQFQFTATALNHPGLSGMFKDSYTGINTPVNLNGTTSVNFSVDANPASQNPNRFMVVFGPASVTPVHFTSVTAVEEGQGAEVSWNVENELNIKEYEVERSTDGIDFKDLATLNADGQDNSSSKYSWEDASGITGNLFYRIKSVGTAGELIYSQIVNVEAGTVNRSLTVYPNPIYNGIVGLQFNNMPLGIYTIEITNLSGQQVAKEVVNNSGEGATQSILLNKNINKGIYQLEAIGPDNNKTFFKILNY